MLKKIIGAASLLVGIQVIFFGILKIGIFLHASSDSILMWQISFLCGVLLAYLVIRRFSKDMGRIYRKAEYCGMAVLYTVLGMLSTYIIGMPIASIIGFVLLRIFCIEGTQYTTEMVGVSFGGVSAFLMLSWYTLSSAKRPDDGNADEKEIPQEKEL